MGIFRDLMQNIEIQEQGERTYDLETKVLILEKELNATKMLLRKTLLTLEEHLGEDTGGDGEMS
jgi:hypothetical protein